MRFIRRDALVGAVGALMAVVLLGAGTLILRNDGIEYPDGSIQRTADAVLVDSLGEVVGPIIGFSATFTDSLTPQTRPVVLFRNDGYPMALQVGGNLSVPDLIFCDPTCNQSLSGPGSVRRIFYLLADCTGPAYIRYGGWRAGNGFDNWMDFHFAIGHENKLFRASISDTSSNVAFQSWGEPRRNPPGSCENDSGTLSLALSVEDTGLDMDDLYTPPFYIE